MFLALIFVFFHQYDYDAYLSPGCKNSRNDLAVPQGRQLFHALLNPNMVNNNIIPTLKRALFIILNLLSMCQSKEHHFQLGWHQKQKCNSVHEAALQSVLM